MPDASIRPSAHSLSMMVTTEISPFNPRPQNANCRKPRQTIIVCIQAGEESNLNLMFGDTHSTVELPTLVFPFACLGTEQTSPTLFAYCLNIFVGNRPQRPCRLGQEFSHACVPPYASMCVSRCLGTAGFEPAHVRYSLRKSPMPYLLATFPCAVPESESIYVTSLSCAPYMRQPHLALSFSVRRSAYSHISRSLNGILSGWGFEPHLDTLDVPIRHV